MLTSTILAVLSLAPTILAIHRIPRSAPSVDACTTPQTYTHVSKYAQVELIDVDTSTSSGQLCCQLCHDSSLDCLIAEWTPKTEQCKLGINNSTTPAEGNATGQCPSGIVTRGEVNNESHEWAPKDGFIVGPCWDPVDGGKWDAEEAKRNGNIFR